MYNCGSIEKFYYQLVEVITETKLVSFNEEIDDIFDNEPHIIDDPDQLRMESIGRINNPNNRSIAKEHITPFPLSSS